jgi:anaerobic magnesium-protoporphyrin IX monomethyl ester cyclase
MAPPLSERSVLLAHSYYLRYDPKQTVKMRPYAPLATLIAASYLRERGIETRLFDAMLAGGVEDFSRELAATPPGIVALVEDNFNFLTKMCTTRMRGAALDMIREARAAGCRIAVNGADATDHPEVYLAAGADAVIPGEPEATLGDIVDAWRRNPDAELTAVPGLVLASPGGTVRTGARPALTDLDALPFPAWELADVERYRQVWTATHGRLSWSMVASRGCPYRCNWCAKPVFGTRYAQRTPAGAAEELLQLRRRVAPDHVWFADDIFGLTPKWIEAFAAEVGARGARTPFMMQSRVNLMKPRVTAALAGAGCEEVWLGVESGAQRILDAMDKGTVLSQIRDATRALRAEGIRVCWFIQLGYLGEGWREILQTRDLIRQERPDDVGVSVSYPLPGTPFYQQVREHLGPKTNWAHSDDLDMLFAGTYTTGFYRSIRDLLHEEARDGAGPGLDARWDALAREERRHHRSWASA